MVMKRAGIMLVAFLLSLPALGREWELCFNLNRAPAKRRAARENGKLGGRPPKGIKQRCKIPLAKRWKCAATVAKVGYGAEAASGGFSGT